MPRDVLCHVFARLDNDWRSLCACACVCPAWHEVTASHAGLWHSALSAEFDSLHELAQRLNVPPVSCTSSSSSSNDTARTLAAGAAAATQLLPRLSQGNACFGADTTAWEDRAASKQLQQLLAASKVHPAAAHQALLARCRAALAAIQGWRVVFTCDLRTVPRPRGPPRAGWPSPMTLGDLLGDGYAIGAVHYQQQQQSCWTRFHLPHELKSDPAIAEMLHRRCLVCRLQALGPAGWFHVQEADPFCIPDDDMAVLVQSHDTGFYAWAASDEDAGDGVDRFGACTPQPWDATYSAGAATAPVAPAAAETMQQQQAQEPTAPAPAPQPAANPGDQVAGDGAQQQQQQPEAPPHQVLRMLVYLHYQQLLDSVCRNPCWQLPQRLPVSMAPRRRTADEIAARISGEQPAFWLHIDLCKLHGGRLGSCTAPLVFEAIPSVAAWSGLARELFGKDAMFECVEEQTVVVVYSVCDNGGGSSDGDSGSGAAAAAAALGCSPAWHQQQQQQRHQAAGISAVAVGQRVVFGEAPAASDDGGQPGHGVRSSLARMLLQDEVMADFTLFDRSGALVLGRAGVEVWTRHDSVQPIPSPPRSKQQTAALARVMLRRAVSTDLDEQDVEALGDADRAHEEFRRAGGLAAPQQQLASPARAVHHLHFKADDARGRSLWENAVFVDAELPSGGSFVALSCSVRTLLQLMCCSEHPAPEPPESE